MLIYRCGPADGDGFFPADLIPTVKLEQHCQDQICPNVQFEKAHINLSVYNVWSKSNLFASTRGVEETEKNMFLQIACLYTVKIIRRFYGRITGNQLPVC